MPQRYAASLTVFVTTPQVMPISAFRSFIRMFSTFTSGGIRGIESSLAKAVIRPAPAQTKRCAKRHSSAGNNAPPKLQSHCTTPASNRMVTRVPSVTVQWPHQIQLGFELALVQVINFRLRSAHRARLSPMGLHAPTHARVESVRVCRKVDSRVPTPEHAALAPV